MSLTQPFGAVLAEVFAEFERAEGEGMPADDELQRLSLAAHRAVIAQNGGQLQRSGLAAYSASPVVQAVAIPTLLDVRY